MSRLAPPRSLGLLRQKRFQLLIGGQLASNIGDACYAVALPWYVLATHGGALLLGTVLAAYGVPRTAMFVVGGYASDRWRPQTVMMATDIGRAAAGTALVVEAALGPARAVVLVPIAILLGAGQGLFLPGSISIVPALVTGEDLQAANALTSGGIQFATLVGPAIGGAFVAVIGPALAFAVDALSFAVSAITLAGLRGVPHPSRDRDTAPAATVEPAVTLRTVLRSERVLLVILMVTVTANLGSGGMSDVALPALVHGPLHAGATGYGAILTAFAGGALVGALGAGQAHRMRRPAIASSAAYLAVAVCMAIIPFAGTIIGVAATMAAFGITNSFGNVLLFTGFQKWAPPNLLGRLSGLLMLGSYGVFPVSVALAAFVVHSSGPRPFFLFAGAILAVAVLIGLSQQSWRDFGSVSGLDRKSSRTGQERAA